MHYRLSDLAEQDLRETWLYVSADASVETADPLIEAIVQRFDLLTEGLASRGDAEILRASAAICCGTDNACELCNYGVTR